MSDEHFRPDEPAGVAVPHRVAAARRDVLAIAGDGDLSAPMHSVESLLFSGEGPLDEAGKEALLGHVGKVVTAPAMDDDAVDRAVGQWLAVVITVAGGRADPLVHPVALAFWWRGKETELPDSREVREVMSRFHAQIPSGAPAPAGPPRPSAAWYLAVVTSAILILGIALLAGWLLSASAG